MASVATLPTVDSETSHVAPFEERDPLPGVTFWTRGDGAFSVSYAPPCHLSIDEIFARIRVWLDEREAKSHAG